VFDSTKLQYTLTHLLKSRIQHFTLAYKSEYRFCKHSSQIPHICVKWDLWYGGLPATPTAKKKSKLCAYLL